MMIETANISSTSVLRWHHTLLNMAARDAYLIWKDIGKPRLGVVYDVMQKANIKYKKCW